VGVDGMLQAAAQADFEAGLLETQARRATVGGNPRRGELDAYAASILRAHAKLLRLIASTEPTGRWILIDGEWHSQD